MSQGRSQAEKDDLTVGLPYALASCCLISWGLGSVCTSAPHGYLDAGADMTHQRCHLVRRLLRVTQLQIRLYLEKMLRE